MKLLTYTRIHLLLLAVWLVVAVVIAVDIAQAGAERGHLAKQRGQDLKLRTELEQQRYNLLKAVDDLAKAPRIKLAVRKLGLLIQPPTALAQIGPPGRRHPR